MPLPTVLAAKLVPPRLAHAVVRRGQMKAVEEGARAKVLYVRAPAGYGKTTLLAEAARRLGWEHAWYRFDALDADPVALVAGLTESLRRMAPSFGASLRALLAGEEPAPPTRLAAGFLKELESIGRHDVYLVLDDYHEVADRADVNELIDLLLLDLPPRAHLILASRSRPGFSTGKLRAADDLRVLGPVDLRFTRRQAEAALQALGSGPSAEDLDLLLESTDGWAAGVVLAGKLAGLTGAVRAVDDAVLSATTSDVYDYLTEEVVRRLPAPAVLLLERTCCLRHVTPGIADRLRGGTGSKRILDELVDDGVFIASDERRESYQYHDLFARYLRDRVRMRGGEAALRELMTATAAALAAEGEHQLAVAASLDAGDLAGVLGLIRQTWGRALFVCGRPLLERLALALDVAGPAYGSWLAVVRGEIASRLAESPMPSSEIAAAADDFAACGDEPAAFVAHTICSIAACRRADYATMLTESASAARLAHDDEPLADALRLQVLSSVYALDWGQAQEALESLERQAGADPAALALARAARVTALVDMGEVAKAAADSRLAAAAVAEFMPARSLAGFQSLLGMLHVYLADYPAAAAAIEAGLAHCERHVASVQLPNLLDTKAFLLASQGDFKQALGLLRECAAAAAAVADPVLAANVDLHLGTTLRRSGDVASSLEFYRRAETACADTAGYERFNAAIGRAFASAQVDDGVTAREAIDLRRLADEAGEHGLQFQCAKARVFAALLEWGRPQAAERPAGGHAQPGEPPAAQLGRALRALLDLGHRNFVLWELSLRRDVLRDYLMTEDDAGLTAAVLGALARHVDGGRLLSLALAREEVALQALSCAAGLDVVQLALLAARARRHPSAEVRRLAAGLAAADQGDSDRLPELTPRELEILALLSAGESNDDIAAALVLSPGTVKTHVHRILTKLSVADRRRAGLLYRERLGLND